MHRQDKLKNIYKKRINSPKSIENEIDLTDLAEYTLDFGYSFYFYNVNILQNNSEYRERLLLEMICIKNDTNAINFRTDIKD